MTLVTLAVMRNISMDPMSYVLLPLVKRNQKGKTNKTYYILICTALYAY